MAPNLISKQWAGARFSELGFVALTAISIVHGFLIWGLINYRPNARRALGEVNGLLPDFGVEVVQFPHEHWKVDDTPLETMVNHSMEAWTDVLPMGGGFIGIDGLNGKAEGKPLLLLPPPLNTPASETRTGYGISVFHQLHCLHALQDAINHAIAKDTSLQALGRERLVHTYHCFSYIRRALMCAADTSLEGQSTGSSRPATTGEGSYHLCRDYAAVKAFAVANRLTDQ